MDSTASLGGGDGRDPPGQPPTTGTDPGNEDQQLVRQKKKSRRRHRLAMALLMGGRSSSDGPNGGSPALASTGSQLLHALQWATSSAAAWRPRGKKSKSKTSASGEGLASPLDDEDPASPDAGGDLSPPVSPTTDEPQTPQSHAYSQATPGSRRPLAGVGQGTGHAAVAARAVGFSGAIGGNLASPSTPSSGIRPSSSMIGIMRSSTQQPGATANGDLLLHTGSSMIDDDDDLGTVALNDSQPPQTAEDARIAALLTLRHGLGDFSDDDSDDESDDGESDDELSRSASPSRPRAMRNKATSGRGYDPYGREEDRIHSMSSISIQSLFSDSAGSPAGPVEASTDELAAVKTVQNMLAASSGLSRSRQSVAQAAASEDASGVADVLSSDEEGEMAGTAEDGSRLSAKFGAAGRMLDPHECVIQLRELVLALTLQDDYTGSFGTPSPGHSRSGSLSSPGSGPVAPSKGVVLATAEGGPVHSGMLLLRALEICLRTELGAWTRMFIEASGVEALVDAMASIESVSSGEGAFSGSRRPGEPDHQPAFLSAHDSSELVTRCVLCLKALMNNPVGLRAVLSDPALCASALRSLALCISARSLHARILTLDILAAICFVPRVGTGLVLDSLTHFAHVRRENRRFQTLVYDLRFATSIDLKISLMSLVNAVCHSSEDLAVRLYIRNEWLDLGVSDVFPDLLALGDRSLRRQITIFETERLEDEHEVMQISDLKNVDWSDPVHMAASIDAALHATGAHMWFNRMMQQLMLFPIAVATSISSADVAVERRILNQYWRLMYEVASQVALVRPTAEGIAPFLSAAGLSEAGPGSEVAGFIDAAEEAALEATAALGSEPVFNPLGPAADYAGIAGQTFDYTPLGLDLDMDRLLALVARNDPVDSAVQELASVRKHLEEAYEDAHELLASGEPLETPASKAASAGPPMPDIDPKKPVDWQNVLAALPESCSPLRRLLSSPDVQMAVGQALNPATVVVKQATPSAPAKPAAAPAPAPPPPAAAPPPPAAAPPPPAPPPPPGAGAPPPPPPPPPPMMGGGPPPPPPPPGGGPPPPPPPPGGGPPPPPGAGPPPPPGAGPPPPPGGFGRAGPAAPAAPAHVPTRKMRPVAWNKLPPRVLSTTLWTQPAAADTPTLLPLTSEQQKKPSSAGTGSGASISVIPLQELEELFGAEEVAPGGGKDASGAGDGDASKKKDAAGAAAAAAGPPELNLIDGKRSNNMAITLSRVRHSNQAIRDALLSVNDALLDEATPRYFNGALPTDEDISIIRTHVSPDGKTDPSMVARLARVERFFWDVCLNVPNYAERVAALTFRCRFDEQSSEVKKNVDAILLASKQTYSAKHLQRIMRTVLEIGNYLNSGTFRGQAQGFRLDALSRLPETRGRPASFTLMHYIAQALGNPPVVLADVQADGADGTPSISIAQREPPRDSVADILRREMPAVGDASRLSLPIIESEMAELRRGLAAIVSLLKIHSPSWELPPAEAMLSGDEADDDSDGPLSPKLGLTSGGVAGTGGQGASAAAAGSGGAEADAAGVGHAPSSSEDRFFTVFSEFARRVHRRICTIEKSLADANKAFEQVALLYGEDPKATSTEQIFGLLNEFMESLARCHKENIADFQRRRQQEAREARAAAAAAAAAASSPALGTSAGGRPGAAGRRRPPPGNMPDDTGDEGPGAMDDLIATIHSGSVFRRTKSQMGLAPPSLNAVRNRLATGGNASSGPGSDAGSSSAGSSLVDLVAGGGSGMTSGIPSTDSLDNVSLESFTTNVGQPRRRATRRLGGGLSAGSSGLDLLDDPLSVDLGSAGGSGAASASASSSSDPLNDPLSSPTSPSGRDAGLWSLAAGGATGAGQAPAASRVARARSTVSRQPGANGVGSAAPLLRSPSRASGALLNSAAIARQRAAGARSRTTSTDAPASAPEDDALQAAFLESHI
ncbi:hypothetical protein H696_05026 [Fonticula alba]|uniref:FH2 domain-containing protein n=1 Tax=Fonticula alba TaxID=691883 RepID=A0A058Z397_FONAL|nr:hypothetical protein H696_05026 [Fonticula alba]KCV68740.1 hypothetical protein H696_05026 [Fonticula alba]|eukprot:XP_009497172.1 hypothetical protein H696_05026 [Fonticula alba]